MNDKKHTPLEIYKILPKNNCQRCLLPSCLAFSAAVVDGRKKLADCPELEPLLIEKMSSHSSTSSVEIDQAEFMDKLQRKVALIDFKQVAPLIGATVKDETLIINSLGKDFRVTQEGNLLSECHIISWVQAPILSYITNKKHTNSTGK